MIMFGNTFKNAQSVGITVLLLVFAVGLSACDGAKPPELMKAVNQFESDEIRDGHIKNMRKNHMDELLHKRDETLIKGIRTKKHSLKACINCHVPEKHNGEVLRHTNPEHFCSTCHGYVAQKLDCFTCHADRPASNSITAKAPDDSIHNNSIVSSKNKALAVNNTTDENAKAVSTKKESASE